MTDTAIESKRVIVRAFETSTPKLHATSRLVTDNIRQINATKRNPLSPGNFRFYLQRVEPRQNT
jgi:hypothetical protein